MLKVCLDLSAAVQQGAGISRYEVQLAQALVAQNSPEVSYNFFYTSPAPIQQLKLAPELAGLPHRALTISNKRWRVNLLLRHFLKRKADAQILPVAGTNIFHGLDYIAPPLRAASVISVCDLSTVLYPQFHSRYNRLYLPFALRICAQKAARIIGISENTKVDLINWLGPSIADKVRVTPLGVSDPTYFEDLAESERREFLAKYGLGEQPYILTVGTVEPRKNQARLLEAYAALVKNHPDTDIKPVLVIAGKPGWGGEYERLLELARQYGLMVQSEKIQPGVAGQVLLPGKVADTNLRALYQGAAVVAYPSLYEGFGLPALEAMAAGAPLVTSNTSSLPEVTGPDGEAALLIDPLSTAALTHAILLILDQPELARQLRHNARHRAKSFTWQRTADLTRQVYEEVAQNAIR